MAFPEPIVLNLAVALGVGLLIGAERERRKSQGNPRSPAGIRTFAVAALSGGLALAVGGALLLATLTAGVMLLTALAYWRASRDDPGLTTEIALVLTVLLGALAVERPALAAGLAAAVAVLLAARSPLHRFIGSVLTPDEVRDALLFAVATLVVLPLLPDRVFAPPGAINPHTIWIVVILVMAISAAGYIAVRLLGGRYGLPLVGFAGGLVSSTATIGAMGGRARRSPRLLASSVAGAVLSTVATVILMSAVLAATSPAALLALAIPLACAGLTAAVYAAAFTVRALKQDIDSIEENGRAFSLRTALLFALIVAIMMATSALLTDRFGETGILVMAAAAGLVDTHATAASVAALVTAGKISATDAVLPVLAAFWVNTASKMTAAYIAGGLPFASRVIPGLILVALAAWAGTFFPQLLP